METTYQDMNLKVVHKTLTERLLKLEESSKAAGGEEHSALMRVCFKIIS